MPLARRRNCRRRRLRDFKCEKISVPLRIRSAAALQRTSFRSSLSRWVARSDGCCLAAWRSPHHVEVSDRRRLPRSVMICACENGFASGLPLVGMRNRQGGKSDKWITFFPGVPGLRVLFPQCGFIILFCSHFAQVLASLLCRVLKALPPCDKFG